MSGTLGTTERAFLDALAETGNVSKACEASGAARTSIYRLRNTDDAFAVEWESALTLGVEALEDEANRRATEGVDEPVFHEGMVCGYKRRYSDTLLIFLLKGAKPHKYRDNFVSPNDPGGHIAQTSIATDTDPGHA